MYETFATGYGPVNYQIIRAADGMMYLIGHVGRYKSADNGRTWEADHPDWSSAGRRAGKGEMDAPKTQNVFIDSNTTMRMKDGRLMMVAWDPFPEIVKQHNMNGTTYTIMLSDDDGLTCSESWPLCDEIGCFYVMNDRLIRLKSGRILLSICKHPTEKLGRGIENEGMVTTAYSDDEGKTWKFGNWLDGNYQEPMAAEAADGTLMMFMRSHRGYMSVSYSKDEGETWSEPQLTLYRMPCAPFCVKRDPYSDYIFMVWDESFPCKQFQYPRTPICMAVSTDNGKTFRKVCVLESEPDKHFGYPSLLFEKDEIFVNYYVMEGTRTFDSSVSRIKVKIFSRDELTVEETITAPLFAK